MFNQPLFFKTVCAKIFVSEVDEELHYQLVKFGPTHQYNLNEFLPIKNKVSTDAFFLAMSIRLFKTFKYALLVRYLTLKYMCEKSEYITENYLSLNGNESFSKTLLNCAYKGDPDYVTIYCASKALCTDIYLTTLPYNGFAELEFLKMPRIFSCGENSKATVFIGKVASCKPTKPGEHFVRDHFAPLVITGKKDSTVEWPNNLLRYKANIFYKGVNTNYNIKQSDDSNKQVAIVGKEVCCLTSNKNPTSTFSFQVELKKSSLNKKPLNINSSYHPRLTKTAGNELVPSYSEFYTNSHTPVLIQLAQHGSRFKYKSKITPKVAMTLILYCKNPLTLDEILEYDFSNTVFILHNNFDHKMIGCRWNHCSSKSYKFMYIYHKQTNTYNLKHYDDKRTHIHENSTMNLSHYKYTANCGNDFSLTVYFSDEIKIIQFLGNKPNCNCRKLLEQIKAFESNITLSPTEIFLKYPNLFKDRQEISNLKRKYMVKNEPEQLKKMKKD